ncbi:hypothetical protein CL3_00300 [butyrate-producing bacterium SM4/1]|nr:hypothetical protein CL3_00300 [butyrate-producing bacterium SM4/1]
MEKFFCGRGTGEGYLFQRSHKYPSPVPGTGTEFFLVLGRFLVWRREESGKIFLKREKKQRDREGEDFGMAGDRRELASAYRGQKNRRILQKMAQYI